MKGDMFLEKNVEYSIRAEYSGNVYAKLGWNADENGDRACLDLDNVQEKLILELAALNKPMVVVIQTGTVITAYKWADKVPSILMAWYPGEEGGNAIAQTLFGDNNPGGKLPITFPKVTGQVPLTYNLLPGKPKNIFFTLTKEDLAMWDINMKYIVEAGEFLITAQL